MEPSRNEKLILTANRAHDVWGSVPLNEFHVTAENEDSEETRAIIRPMLPGYPSSELKRVHSGVGREGTTADAHIKKVVSPVKERAVGRLNRILISICETRDGDRHLFNNLAKSLRKTRRQAHGCAEDIVARRSRRYLVGRILDAFQSLKSRG